MSREKRCRLAGYLPIALLLSVPLQASAASAEYLDAVRADLAEFASGHFELTADNNWQRNAETGLDGTASLADFETFVKTKFRGTYILFSRLTEAQKISIWEAYLATGDLGGIRSNIYAARRDGKASSGRTLSNLPLDF